MRLGLSKSTETPFIKLRAFNRSFNTCYMSGIGEFCDNALKEIGIYCGNLLKLDLSHCRRVDDHGIRSVAVGCTKLHDLRLLNTDNITGVSLHEIFKNLNHLKILHLIKCVKLSDHDFDILIQIHNNSTQNKNSIFSSNESDNYKLLSVKNQLTCSSQKNCLTDLNISGCIKLTDYSISLIAKAFSIHLIKLNISYIKNITDHSVRCIALSCMKIQNLDISKCPNITDEAIEILSKSLKNLTILKLNGNNLVTLNQLLISLENLDFAVISKNWLGYEPKLFANSMIETKEQINKKLKQIVLIQSYIRRKLVYKDVSVRRRRFIIEKFVPKFQGVVRGYLQRKRYKMVLFHIRCIKCSIKIQSW